MASHGRIVPQQDSLGCESGVDAVQHVLPPLLEAGGQELRDHVRPVPVHDEGRQAIPLPVHHPVRSSGNVRAPPRGGGDVVAPPCGVHGLPPGGEQAQPDFRLR